MFTKSSVAKKLIITLWFLFMFFVGTPGYSQNQDSTDTTTVAPTNIELKTFVESSKVPLNRKVVFHIQLSWIGELSRYQFKSIPQPILTNLVMEGSGSSNKLEPIGDGRLRAIKTITYQFRPVELGMAYIDGIVVKYLDTTTNKEETLQSQRVMVEIVDPVPENGGKKARAVIYIVLLIIFFGTIIYFVIVYFHKRRNRETMNVRLVAPAEVFLQKIGQEVDPKAANLREMVSRLSKIFREFLGREFKILAVEASSEELLTQLRKCDVDEADILQLQKMFKELDMIKYSGKPVDPAEFSNIYGVIEAFMLKRKQIWEAHQEQVKEV